MKEKLLNTILSTGEIPLSTAVLALALALAIGVYIYVIYVFVSKSYFFSKNFSITVALMTVVTTAIILALRSSLVISLGMVGALSIVRFRTAIKEPMDLLFLFWAIAEGIICGAGLLGLGCILCVIMPVGLFVFEKIPVKKSPYILVVNSEDKEADVLIENTVKKHAKSYKVKSKNITKRGLDMIIELNSKNSKEIMDELKAVKQLDNISILEHDGETRY